MTVKEVYGLNSELLGAINQENGERITNGLMAGELSVVTKFKLNDLLGNIAKFVESVDKLRNDLVDKYGDTEKGSDNKFLNFFIKNEDGSLSENPKVKKFGEEMDKLYVQEVEFECMDISILDLDFKTTEVYPVMFKVIEKLSATE